VDIEPYFVFDLVYPLRGTDRCHDVAPALSETTQRIQHLQPLPSLFGHPGHGRQCLHCVPHSRAHERDPRRNQRKRHVDVRSQLRPPRIHLLRDGQSVHQRLFDLWDILFAKKFQNSETPLSSEHREGDDAGNDLLRIRGFLYSLGPFRRRSPRGQLEENSNMEHLVQNLYVYLLRNDPHLGLGHCVCDDLSTEIAPIDEIHVRGSVAGGNSIFCADYLRRHPDLDAGRHSLLDILELGGGQSNESHCLQRRNLVQR